MLTIFEKESIKVFGRLLNFFCCIYYNIIKYLRKNHDNSQLLQILLDKFEISLLMLQLFHFLLNLIQIVLKMLQSICV